jgi:hypothetical protein
MDNITQPRLMQSHIEDIRFAATKMRGAERRAFQSEMTLKYCKGKPRLAERTFGWGRENVETGLAEKLTGIICIGSQPFYCGDKCWEEKQPEAAEALRQLAEYHVQQDPTFRKTIGYTRLTAKEALKQLREKGFTDAQLPAPSTMAEILNRMGYRLRKVVKAKPQKKFRKPIPFLKI